MELKILSLNLFILFDLIHGISCAKRVPQIKLVGTQIKYLNPDYNDKVVCTIHRLNETFNYLSVFWELKKDPPADTAVYLKVYVTNSTYQDGNLVLENVTPVCKPSQNRLLLPTMMQVPESVLNTQCLRNGTIQIDDLIQYRFEVLVPKIGCLGSYYRCEYKFGNDAITIGTVDYYNEWGYLHLE